MDGWREGYGGTGCIQAKSVCLYVGAELRMDPLAVVHGRIAPFAVGYCDISSAVVGAIQHQATDSFKELSDHQLQARSRLNNTGTHKALSQRNTLNKGQT